MTPEASANSLDRRAASPSPGSRRIHAGEVQDDGRGARLGVHELADAVVERLRGGERKAEVQAQDDHAVERLVARMLVRLAEDLRARLTAEHRDRRRDRDVDEPDQRERRRRSRRRRGRPRRAPRRSRRGRSRSRPGRRGAGGAAPRTSIMPKTTASMINAASTAFGRSENSGARNSSVRITSAPVTSDASGVRAPEDSLSELAERLVETGMPWNTPGAGVRHALGDRLLVDVDPVAMAGGERACVSRGLREADQQQRERGDADRRGVVREDGGIGQRRRGQAARDVADERDAVSAEVQQRGREQSADHEHQCAGDGRRQRSAARG